MSYIYVIKTPFPPEKIKTIHGLETESIGLTTDEEITFDDLVEAIGLKVVKEGREFKWAT